MTEIHDTDKIMMVVSLDRSPSLTSPVALLLYKKKTSGTEVRRTQDVKLRFVGFIRFVGYNFGRV